MNLAHQESKKKKRRKRCRYEREHSMSAPHIDWTENPLLGLKACAILDDSSRMIIAGREYVHCNTENSIKLIDELVREYWDICPLRELILDHGSEFDAHKINEDGSWDSEFKRHVEALGIKLLLAAVRHPQTNGKVEKWFHTYKRFRGEFKRLRSSLNGISEGFIELSNLKNWNHLKMLSGKDCQLKQNSESE